MSYGVDERGREIVAQWYKINNLTGERYLCREVRVSPIYTVISGYYRDKDPHTGERISVNEAANDVIRKETKAQMTTLVATRCDVGMTI